MSDSDFQPVSASIEFDVSNAITSAEALKESIKRLDDAISTAFAVSNVTDLIDSLTRVNSQIDSTGEAFKNAAQQAAEFANQSFPEADLLNYIEKLDEYRKIESDALQFELDNEAQLLAIEEARVTEAQKLANLAEIQSRYTAPTNTLGYVDSSGSGDNSIGDDSSSGGDSLSSGLSGLGGRGFSTAGSLGRDLGLGGIGKAIADVGKVITTARLAERLIDMAGGLDAVLAVALPLGVALAVMAAAWNVLQSEVKAANQALEEAKSSIDEYYKAISNGTTESIQKQLNDLEAQKAEADKKAQDIQNALTNGFSGAQTQFGDLGARLITAAENAGAFGGGVKGLTDDMDAAKKKSNELQGQIDGLTNALTSNNIALNNFQSNLQKSIAWEIQRDNLIRSSSEKQIDDLIAKNEIEQRVYQEAIDKEIAKEFELRAAGTLTAEAQSNLTIKVNEYKGKLTDLQTQYTDLTGVVLSVAEANDKLKTSIQAEADIATDTAKYLQSLSDVNTKRDDAQAKADDKYLTEASNRAIDYNTKRANEVTTFNDAITDADNKQAKKQSDGKIKLNDEISAIQTKADDAIAKLKTDQSTKEQQISFDLSYKKQEIESNLSDKLQSIYVDLANKISDIRSKANQDEIDAAYNLDARKIADIQRKEAVDIANAQKDSSRKDESANKDAKKQEEAAQDASDKIRTKLEKDNELKIRQIEAQASKEESLKLAQGTQALADQQAQYEAERTAKIDDFKIKLKNEDDHEKELNQQKYDAWIQEKKDIDKKYDDQKTLIGQKYDEQTALIKNKLDDVKVLIGGKLDDQHGLYGKFFDNMKGTQTKKQAEIETAWDGLLSDLKDKINTASVPGSHIQSSSPTSGAYQPPFSSSPTSPISYTPPNGGDIFRGGTPGNNLSDSQLKDLLRTTYGVLGAPDIGSNGVVQPYNSTGGSSNMVGGDLNLGDFYNSGYKGVPGFASGLDRVPHDNFIASLHADEKILNKQEADDYRSSSGRQGHTTNFSDGAIVINGTNLSKEELKDVMIEALSDKMREFIG